MTTNTPSSEVEGIVQEAHQIAVDYMRRVGLKEAAIKNVPYNHAGHVLIELKEYLRTTLTTLTTNHDERMRAMIREMLTKTKPFYWDEQRTSERLCVLSKDIEAIASKYITSNDETI